MKHLILVIKKSILALCMLVFALVGGCGTLTPIVEADYAVASGEARQVIGSVSLTSSEKQIINHAINRYMQFTEKWRNADIEANEDQFLDDFNELKAQYLAVDKIVRKRWDKYSPDNQANIKQFQAAVHNFDAAVNRYIRLKMWASVMLGTAEFVAASLGLARSAAL